MPRVTITFDCPAENADMRAALAGREALAALHEVDECLRRLADHAELPAWLEGRLKEIRDEIPEELLGI